MLPPMRYKGFTFPHNPRVYEISYTRDVAVHKVPMGVYSMQDLGRTCRVLAGEGEFYGADAYDKFKALANIFYSNGPGALYHPIWQMSQAYFTKLRLRQEPRRDYVAYSFEFREGFFGYAPMRTVSSAAASAQGAAAQGSAAAAAQYYTVAAGDTLWGIAQRNGMTLARLLGYNPSIANPNLIRVGERVRIS